jgi:hypothetical protein
VSDWPSRYTMIGCGAVQIMEDQDMRELTKAERETIARDVGICPMCKYQEAVIYRSSSSSLTMRCKRCGLQWTCTFTKIEQAATWLAEERRMRHAPTPEHKTEYQRRRFEEWWDLYGGWTRTYEVFTGKPNPLIEKNRRDRGDPANAIMEIRDDE